MQSTEREQTIRRLAEERESLRESEIREGRRDGEQWALKDASYGMLETIASQDVLDLSVISADPGDVFGENCGRSSSYIDGWHQGVQDVFNEVGAI